MPMTTESVQVDNSEHLYPTLPQVNNENGESKSKDANDGNNQSSIPAIQTMYLRNQIFAAFILSMGSLLTGFSYGFIGPAINSIQASDMGISWNELSWFISLLTLSAAFGSFIGIPVIAYLGRRKTIMVSTVPFATGWLLIAIARNIICLCAGQVLCGLGIGIVSFTVPVYLGESLHPKVRGALGILPSTLQHIGILLAILSGTFINWSLLALFGGVLSISFCLLMFRTPETPKWYVTKGQIENASKSLQWFRGNTNIEAEMENLTTFRTELDTVKGYSCGLLFKMEYMPALLISLGLIFFQLLNGIVFVIYSTTYAVHRYNIFTNNDTLIIIRGITFIIASLLAIALIDRIGRKRLLYISSAIMVVTLTLLGVFFYAEESGIDMSPYKWILISLHVVYFLGFSIGVAPIPWLMLGEILPSKIRGTAAAICAGFHWAAVLYISKTFQNVMESLHTYGTLWFYAGICGLGLIFVLIFVPETRGKSLEEIEKEMTDDLYNIRHINDTRSEELVKSEV